MILYLCLLVPFLILDGLMLFLVMEPLFRAHLGDLMAAPPRWAPAVAFYLLYPVGILALVARPALREGRPAAVPALILGATAYGTYELTSYALLTAWHPLMVAVDLAWGAVLTCLTTLAGLALARRLGQG